MTRFIIAGTHSGVGKTTITAALIRALTRRGLKVQPFKVGPDYIDPGYHSLASGNTTRNLDGWMLKEGQIREILGRNAPPGVTAVIEGVMGLFDGYSSRGEEGSTAHIAKITGTPVILIIDGSKMARSAAAIALGYREMDREVDIKGIIFNRLGGDNHYRILKEAVEFLNIPVLGYLPRDLECLLSERHLGLVPTGEMERVEEFLEYWAEKVENYLDLEKLLEIASRARPVEMPGELTMANIPSPSRQGESLCNLALVRDQAFTFYYPENLELLQYQGASIREVSLLKEKILPQDCHGLYIGGGFPEVFAGELSRNESMRESLREAASKGMPIYGECGGFMYLTRGIRDLEGNYYPMAGLFNCEASMGSRRKALGYTLVETRRDNFLSLRGEKTRGHEFHWSEINKEHLEDKDFVYSIINKGYRLDGLLEGNVLGSYVHLHFYSNPSMPRRFVEACLKYKNK